MNRADDYDRFRELVQMLCATWSQDATEARYAAYWLGLADLDLAAVERACGRAIRQCKFMPAPAELRELAGAGSLALADRAVAAWDTLLAEIRAHSGYRSVDFADQVINATVRQMGGLERVSGLPSEELLKWARKDFLATYAALARSAASLSAEATAYLPGIRETDCAPEHRARLAAPARVGGGVRALTGGVR